MTRNLHTNFSTDARRFSVNYVFLSMLLVTLFILDLVSGAVFIPLQKVLSIFSDHPDPSADLIVVGIRLPKAIVAICAGAGLSVAGLLMQTFYRNPLAGPFVLGVNSMASLFVALFIAGGMSEFSLLHALGLPLSAFTGAMAGLLLLLALSVKVKDSTQMLLMGMMLGFLAGALESLVAFSANAQQLKSFVVWGMASFSATGELSDVLVFAIVIAGTCTLALLFTKSLNLLLAGEDQAKLLGVHVRRFKILLLIAVALLSGTVTAYCGPVGFIGLAIPHLVRIWFRTTHHFHQIMGSILTGGCFALFCDFVGNLPIFDMTLPVNVITSLFGAPFVFWMIFSKKQI